MKNSLRILLVAAVFVRCSHAQATATAEADDTAASSSQQQQPRKLNNKAPPAWIKEQFPNPQVVPEECRTTSNRFCDPDGIMIDMERQRLLQRIEQLETKHSIACKGASADKENKHEIQMSVALANRMNLLSYGSAQDRSEAAAQQFAVHLHNRWGVGVDTHTCGGTGMLLFFSIRDRAFYLSRGKALEHTLTDARVDRIMEHQVKPLLRQERYSEALLELIDGLDHYLDRGPPTKSEVRQEWLETLLPLSFVAVIVGMMGWQMRNEHRETQAYANVESQLSQLDRDRAEALQGRYQCRSCPICLETFQTDRQTEAGVTDGATSDGSPTDGAPTTVGAPAAEGAPATEGPPDADGAEDEQQPLSKGSDGLPLKLLRCGHVFDETCWSEWVSSGSGNIRRCPICQQDVAGNNNEDDAATSPSHQLQRQQPAGDVDTNDATANDADNRVFRQFHRERNFRLARLGMRFPHYIGRQQLNAWTQSNYDGTLARDPGFVRNNPRVIRERRQSSMGQRGGGSSFGGGSSGGGRGGSW